MFFRHYSRYKIEINLHRQSDRNLITFQICYTSFHSAFSTSTHHSFSQSAIKAPDLFLTVRCRQCTVCLVAVPSVHLDQTNQRGDCAHQPHQPVGESSRPQEAGWHPMNGITKISHAAEDGENFPTHLSAELRATVASSIPLISLELLLQ